MLGGDLERGAFAMHGIDSAEERPDEARRQHDGFRLAKLNGLLDGHETVGDEEDQECQIADGMPRQVDARGGFQGMSRDDEQGKQREGGQGPHPSANAFYPAPQYGAAPKQILPSLKLNVWVAPISGRRDSPQSYQIRAMGTPSRKGVHSLSLRPMRPIIFT